MDSGGKQDYFEELEETMVELPRKDEQGSVADGQQILEPLVLGVFTVTTASMYLRHARPSLLVDVKSQELSKRTSNKSDFE